MMQTEIEKNNYVVLLSESYIKPPAAAWFQDRMGEETIYIRNSNLELGKQSKILLCR